MSLGCELYSLRSGAERGVRPWPEVGRSVFRCLAVCRSLVCVACRGSYEHLHTHLQQKGLSDFGSELVTLTSTAAYADFCICAGANTCSLQSVAQACAPAGSFSRKALPQKARSLACYLSLRSAAQHMPIVGVCAAGGKGK